MRIDQRSGTLMKIENTVRICQSNLGDGGGEMSEQSPSVQCASSQTHFRTQAPPSISKVILGNLLKLSDPQVSI